MVSPIEFAKPTKTEKDDCILGVFANYGFEYPGIEQYMVSIARSGYTGRKVLLCWNLRPDVHNMLTRWGYELVYVDPPPRETKVLPVNFFIHRMGVVADYLSEHYREFRDVFWLDIKDLVVQTNPSRWMQANRKKSIVASTECVTLEQEETNNLWIKDVCGAAAHRWLKDREVINGGTFAGEAEIMKDVFCDVYSFIQDYDGEYPACQPAINMILHSAKYCERVEIPRWTEGFAACLHPMWAVGRPSHPRDLVRPYLRDVPPAFDIEKRLLYARRAIDKNSMSLKYHSSWGGKLEFTFLPKYNPRTGVELISATEYDVPFCVVHGWDRDWNMKHIFCETYSFERLAGLTEVYQDYRQFLEKGTLGRLGRLGGL